MTGGEVEHRGDARRTCLMVAFHYPPCRTSSGYLRAEKFVSYLPRAGWRPLVLTASVTAYGDGSSEIEPSSDVYRAFAFDAKARLSIKGKYLEFLTVPDRWWAWLPGAVWRGWRLWREVSYQLVWSTYPTPTALLVGYCLSRLSRRPWVVDLRDPVIDEVHPTGKLKRWVFSKIESLAVHRSAALVVTTPGALRLYRKRYPGIPAGRVVVIGNGFDEVDFADTEAGARALDQASKLTLLHSGTLYPLERDPIPFLDALVTLKRAGTLSASTFEVIFRSSGHDDWLAARVEERGLMDVVRLLPGVDYRDALAEMARVDGLLVFQAANCPAQIPAKLYEYFRSATPILGVVDSAGDTAELLRQSGSDHLADPTDHDAIARELHRFLDALRSGTAAVADAYWVAGFSREHRSMELAVLFDRLVSEARDSDS